MNVMPMTTDDVFTVSVKEASINTRFNDFFFFFH